MFLDKVIPRKYYIKSEVCALEILFNETETLYHFTLLKNKNNRIEIVNKGTLKSLDELPKHILKSKIPLIIVLNGKGVIVKKIQLIDYNQDLNDIIESNLPALNKEEFILQCYKQSDNSAFITFCRKEMINEFLDKLKKQKYDIADVFIGLPVIIGLSPLWNDLNCIPTSSHQVELSNGLLDRIVASTETKTVTLNDLTIEKDSILGFSAGISYSLQNQIKRDLNPLFERIYETHVERNKIKYLSLLLVAITFLISITNVLFYTNYFDENNKVEAELGVYQSKNDQINELLINYESKKNLIENAGLLNHSKLSEFADKIGASLPQDVVLRQLHFNPQKETESEDSLLVFNPGQIIVKGNCNKSLIVNEWLNVLKMQDFVKEIKLRKFLYNNDGVLPNFEIEIITR